LSKKDERLQRLFELIKQSIAARQERIKVLWDECKGLPKRRDLNDLLDELEKLTNKYGPSPSDRLRSLHELVGLQDREIEYLTQFRRELERIRHYYPDQLQCLSSASLAAELQPVLAEQNAVDELKRRVYKCPGGVGLIEWEFGGGAEAERRKSSLGWSGLPYEPTCLDEILRGGVGERRTLPRTVNPVTGEAVVIDTLVDMRRLEALFGLERHRFPKKLQLHKRRVGREIVYEWRGVVEIMRALLTEPSRRKRRGEGKKPERALPRWPRPALRARVLSAIEERINVVCVDAEIADAFLALIHP
jgi:hypothetical protein